MIKIALIAGTAQGIGSGVHPESGFENTSKLFICVGNKDSGAESYKKTIEAFLSTLRVVSATYIKRLFSLQERQWNQASRVWIKTQKRFIFAEEFIRERNGSKVIPMTNDSTNVNRTRL